MIASLAEPPEVARLREALRNIIAAHDRYLALDRVALCAQYAEEVGSVIDNLKREQFNKILDQPIHIHNPYMLDIYRADTLAIVARDLSEKGVDPARFEALVAALTEYDRVRYRWEHAAEA